MKKILVINGHPNEKSFNFGIAEEYIKGAKKSGAEVEEIVISKLNFNPNLQYGYQKRMDLEPDLLEAFEKIKKADHMVWVHPVWWGGFPAIMKGFIDRLFLPGLTYQPRENSLFWEKLLKGKTAHIISTLDQPVWYYGIVYKNPSINQLKKAILEFCGVKVKKVTLIGIIKTSDESKRKKWLEKVYNLGLKTT